MTDQFLVPNDYAIHIVEKRMSIDALIIALYNTPSEKTFKHFKFVNSHIVDGYAKARADRVDIANQYNGVH
ncbi:hypothetical protein P4S81_07420 [Pseudoalteromonas sp. B28]